MIGRPLQAGFGWRPHEPAPAERQLPPSDRSETPAPGPNVGPLPGETFSETLRRLAHERHGTPLDAEPPKPTREPGSDDE